MGKALDLIEGFEAFQNKLYDFVEVSYQRFLDCWGIDGLIDAELGLIRSPNERVDGLNEGIFNYIVRGKNPDLRRCLTDGNITTLERCLDASDIRTRFVDRLMKKGLVPVKDTAYWAERKNEQGCDTIQMAAYLDMERESDEEIQKMKGK